MSLTPPELPQDAAALPLELSPVPAEQLVAGAPHTGYRVLGAVDGRELGVWEMTAGAMRDVEVDEVFVVLAGSARVDFTDGRAALELAPGVVASLRAGDATVWTVPERIRKLVLS